MHKSLRQVLRDSAAAVEASYELCEASHRNDAATVDIVVLSRETIEASRALLARPNRRLP